MWSSLAWLNIRDAEKTGELIASLGLLVRKEGMAEEEE
jgi:hypothetical protein